MINTIAQFNSTLVTFTNQSKNCLENLSACSRFALKHVENCGDLGPLQRIFDAMPNGYANKTGLIKWAMTFAPINFEGGKFTKDKSPTALPYALKEAFSQDFWEAFPTPTVIIDFAIEDVNKALESLVKKFSGKKYQTKDVKATNALKTLAKLKLS